MSKDKPRGKLPVPRTTKPDRVDLGQAQYALFKWAAIIFAVDLLVFLWILFLPGKLDPQRVTQFADWFIPKTVPIISTLFGVWIQGVQAGEHAASSRLTMSKTAFQWTTGLLVVHYAVVGVTMVLGLMGVFDGPNTGAAGLFSVHPALAMSRASIVLDVIGVFLALGLGLFALNPRQVASESGNKPTGKAAEAVVD